MVGKCRAPQPQGLSGADSSLPVFRADPGGPAMDAGTQVRLVFVHLHTHSPYSFLDGASDLEVLVKRAATLGMPALALTDHDNVCAAVKFVTLCREYAIAPILGAELTMEDSTHLTMIAQSRHGYANLCQLITASFANGGRLTPKLPWAALGV